jgi:hypothetical protein
VHHRSEVAAMYFEDRMTKSVSYKGTRIMCKLAKTNMNVSKYDGIMRAGKLNSVIFLMGNDIASARDEAAAKMSINNPGNWTQYGGCSFAPGSAWSSARQKV